MKKNRKGCYNEKIAICYLMAKGLDVFDSCQTNGAVDLITFNPDTGDVQCWEVKTENFRLSGNKKGVPISRGLRNKKFKSIINLLYVHNGKCREGKRK
jgi:hypothetical protein